MLELITANLGQSPSSWYWRLSSGSSSGASINRKSAAAAVPDAAAAAGAAAGAPPATPSRRNRKPEMLQVNTPVSGMDAGVFCV